MPIFLKFNDEQYAFTSIKEVRKVVRAILLDEENKVILHTIYRNDKFCNQAYFETPGGGVDEGETYKIALKREIKEEVGAQIELIAYIGQVIDYYNLINRKNINHYYLCKVKARGDKHFASAGDQFIKETKSYEINEAIRLMSSQEDCLVSKLVKQRELPILVEASKMLTMLKD